MSQFCLVQHINLFRFRLALDSYESDFVLLLYSDQFLFWTKLKQARRWVSLRLVILVVVTFENACLKSDIAEISERKMTKTPSLTVM